MFLRNNVYYHEDPESGILLYFDQESQEWKMCNDQQQHQHQQQHQSGGGAVVAQPNLRSSQDPIYHQRTNPYSQLKHHELNFNNFDQYVIPLEEQELIQPTQPKNNYVDPSDYNGTQAMQNAWKEMKPSPVQTQGLRAIQTSRIEQPSENPENLKRQREREDAELRIPRADPNSLRPIDCNNRTDNSPAVSSFKRARDQDLENVNVRDPPPETVRCGWSEYQGGATWEDINRYRDQEMSSLRTIQEKQRLDNEPVYYY